jgi:tRNA-dihydrouridine synthase 3
MDESPAELVVDTEKLSVEPPPSNGSQPTPEELAAKAIAPVKKEFLRPPPPRTSSTSTGLQNDTVSQTKVVSVKEKKSKRQLKRERHQVLSLSLCLSPFIYICVCVCVCFKFLN